MTGHNDMIVRLNMLPSCTVLASFDSFYSQWISVFDSPTYVLADLGSALAAELIKEKPHDAQAQL